MSKQRLQRGVFRSVAELQTAINRFIEETNLAPRPFVWTADPRKIIAAAQLGHQVLDSIHYVCRKTTNMVVRISENVF